jgi:hypothetical protein
VYPEQLTPPLEVTEQPGVPDLRCVPDGADLVAPAATEMKRAAATPRTAAAVMDRLLTNPFGIVVFLSLARGQNCVRPRSPRAARRHTERKFPTIAGRRFTRIPA